MICKKSLSVVSGFIALLFILCSINVNAQPDGGKLFKDNCTQCHSVGKGVVIGPDLKDIKKRRQESWILPWVKSSTSVIKGGDPYAVELFKKFNVQMPDQPLKDDEIKAVIAYITTESEKAPVAKVTPGAVTASDKGDETNWLMWLLIAVPVLYLAVKQLAKVKNILLRQVSIKEGTPVPQPLSAWKQTKGWMKGNKKIVALILIAFMVVSSVQGWYVLAGIGISQGYKPSQPIAFSHKIHAGENGIACVYCHFGAEKSKTAGIPSANVCMNCHKGIKEGTLTGTTEISKIYKALDYDPATQTYGKHQQPIEWTRVHNLPDFAYFNHSQHVKVGGIKCQTCHGPVEEMTVDQQYTKLTMGWCIECHRNTEVKMAGNHYYDDFHKKLEAQYGKDAKITVDKIGGMECSRCHY